VAGNRIEYTINANQSKSENLQFIAQSVIIDNPNSYWIYFQYTRRWVPPFTSGVVQSYAVHPSIAAFETDSLPPNIAAAVTLIDTGAKIIFVEDVIPENGGSATQVGLVQNVNVVTGSTVIATQAATDTYKVSLPSSPLPVSVPRGPAVYASAIAGASIVAGGILLLRSGVAGVTVIMHELVLQNLSVSNAVLFLEDNTNNYLALTLQVLVSLSIDLKGISAVMGSYIQLHNAGLAGTSPLYGMLLYSLV
jgi:hypothetical protein